MERKLSGSQITLKVMKLNEKMFDETIIEIVSSAMRKHLKFNK